jgi:hypothetical protein
MKESGNLNRREQRARRCQNKKPFLNLSQTDRRGDGKGQRCAWEMARQSNKKALEKFFVFSVFLV